MRQPIYSGPGKTGTCICGCTWEQHHLNVVMMEEYIEETHERYIPDECCAYGFQEMGGKKYNEEKQEWEDHCEVYRDAGDHCEECRNLKTGHKMGCGWRWR